MIHSHIQPSIRVLCSSGTFSRHSDFTDHYRILENGPGLPVDGLEVMFYEQWYSWYEEIASELVALGMTFPVVHAEKDIGPALGKTDRAGLDKAFGWFDANCHFASLIGAGVVVLHLWGHPESDTFFERNLSAVSTLVDIALRHGVALAVETIPCTVGDPLTRIEQVLERDPRCCFTLDTEFLALHKEIEAALAADWLWQKGRVAHIHIKDFDGHMHDAEGRRHYVHPCEGNIDFDRFFAGLKAREYNGTVSLESPVISRDGSLDIPRLRRSLTLVNAMVAEAYKKET
ncbi:MAG: TIM barrel protein [Chloroflexota bacterium]